MAIVRTAGTEIIRSAHFETVDDDQTVLIQGVQHHIYTVLSVICNGQSMASVGNYIRLMIIGYDSLAGTTAQEMIIFKQDMNTDQTYVWNDKFSFTGAEPTGVSTTMNTVAEQDAIADQGTSTAQTLFFLSSNNNNYFDVHITYIDQNNA